MYGQTKTQKSKNCHQSHFDILAILFSMQCSVCCVVPSEPIHRKKFRKNLSKTFGVPNIFSMKLKQFNSQLHTFVGIVWKEIQTFSNHCWKLGKALKFFFSKPFYKFQPMKKVWNQEENCFFLIGKLFEIPRFCPLGTYTMLIIGDTAFMQPIFDNTQRILIIAVRQLFFISNVMLGCVFTRSERNLFDFEMSI